MTKLHEAVRDNNLPEVKRLLEKGVDVRKNFNGNTPVHLSAMNGHEEITQLLLDYGIDYDTKNQFGETPLDYAKALGNTEIVTLLEKHGGENAHSNLQ